MNHRIRTGFPVLLLALGANDAGAHHSTAVFTMDKVVELRGVVVDFKLRSPHSSFVIDARTFADGQQGASVERWEIESEALPVLRTMGIDANTFKPGDAVRIMASPHRDASFKFAHAQVLVAADGKEYGFASTNRVFSPSLRVVLGGGAAQAPAAAAAAPSAVGVQRLAGRWQAPLPIMAPNGESPLPLNEAGLAARRAYDRKASPANTCEPMTVPDVYSAPFYLFDVRLTDAQAVLHHEAYDIQRTVPLRGTPAAADPRGWFGTVSGRIDGDVLIVDSSGYAASKWGLGAEVQPMGNGADVPSSAQKAVRERYSVSDDGSTLTVEYTITDPVYLTEPYTSRVELTRVPEGTQMYPYDCDVESAGMWSRTVGEKPLRVGAE